MSMIKTARGWRNLDGYSGEHPLIDLNESPEGDLTQESLSLADKDKRRVMVSLNSVPNLAKKPN